MSICDRNHLISRQFLDGLSPRETAKKKLWMQDKRICSFVQQPVWERKEGTTEESYDGWSLALQDKFTRCQILHDPSSKWNMFPQTLRPHVPPSQLWCAAPFPGKNEIVWTWYLCVKGPGKYWDPSSTPLPSKLQIISGSKVHTFLMISTLPFDSTLDGCWMKRL